MDFRELVQIAIGALLANKLRTFLTALGIIIGTASVISMLAIGNGSKSSVESRIASLGANTITVTAGSTTTSGVASAAGSAQTLTIDDYKAIKTDLGPDLVDGVSPEQSKNFQLIYADKNTNTSVTAVTEDYLTVRNYTLKDGAFFSQLQDDNNARVIVLGATTVTNLFGTADPIGQQVQIGNMLFTVIGILNAKGTSGFTNQDDLALVPLGTGSKILNASQSLRSIAIAAKSQDVMTGIQNEITGILIQRHNITDPTNLDFTISNSQQTLDTLSSVSNTFTYLLAGIASISLLVGGIGIMNTMIISITERTREIGLRKAIGAKDNLILMQFVVESIVLSSLGAIFGIILGVSIALIFNVFGIVAAQIDLVTVVLSASISMLVGLIFGIYPARKASLLSPIDALRYE